MTAAPAPEPAASPAASAKVPTRQVNVRLPVPLIEAMETRRASRTGPDGRPLSQSKWVERALWYAITNAPQPQNPSRGRTRSRPGPRPTT